MVATPTRSFRRQGFQVVSWLFTTLTGLATWLILAMLAVILISVVYYGWECFSWRFMTTGSGENVFDLRSPGVLPMIVGTCYRVILMSLFVMPAGVIAAIYLTEYARTSAWSTRIIRGAVNNLAGVPSIVFGLFGLGFFIHFLGRGIDGVVQPGNPSPLWGKDCLLWASLTLAVMTLPVVIVATEEALRAIPQGLREASLALGATKLQTIIRIVIPEAFPGILTGAILAIGRAAGEVAPILFTGAVASMSTLPHGLTDRFMDLGYHVFILSTQGPDIEKTRPILFATVMVLLLLTFALNLAAVLIRGRIRAKRRSTH
jgi:phosphate transport system permease protein